jgi:flavin-dependent dehydrogenase
MTASLPDILVAGAGPAGLAVAIRARLAGLTVAVVDARRVPIDKACGEGLMPDGAALLARLGVAVPVERRFALRGIRWLEGELAVEGAFPGAPGWGVRRHDLHAALVDRAAALGADLRFGTVVHGLAGGGLDTSAGALRGRWLVAADGLGSRLRRAAGLAARPARRRRFGLTRHYALEPWTDHVEVHWSDGAEAYVTPLAARLVGVALLFAGMPSDFEAILARFPALARRLAGAPPAGRQQGAGPLEQRAKAVVRGPLALVGDAAGYVDAITGEGLSLALRDAFAVVEAIACCDLARYAAAHRRGVRLPEAMIRALLAIEARPRLRRRFLRALARDPALFRALLAVHVRARPPGTVASWALPRLAWGVAQARAAAPGTGIAGG